LALHTPRGTVSVDPDPDPDPDRDIGCLYVGCDDEVLAFDLANGERKRFPCDGAQPISGLAIAEDGARLFVVTDQTVSLLDTQTGDCAADHCGQHPHCFRLCGRRSDAVTGDVSSARCADCPSAGCMSAAREQQDAGAVGYACADSSSPVCLIVHPPQRMADQKAAAAAPLAVEVVAGNESRGHADGALGISQFTGPFALCRFGELLLVTDRGNHVIRLVDGVLGVDDPLADSKLIGAEYEVVIMTAIRRFPNSSRD
jgi:hypothetical protein